MITSAFVHLQNSLSDRQDERGAAMAEYGLLLALVALAAILVLATFGDNISAVFDRANDDLEAGLQDAAGSTPATP